MPANAAKSQPTKSVASLRGHRTITTVSGTIAVTIDHLRRLGKYGESDSNVMRSSMSSADIAAWLLRFSVR